MPEELHGPMHVNASLLAQVLGTASTQIQRQRDESRFAILCTTEEGVACRFTTGAWNDPLLEAVAAPLVNQIGWKRIEHAPGRQIVMRCTIPGGAVEDAQCQIDLGSGFEPLPVRTSGEA